MAPLLHNMEYLGAYSAVMSVCVKRWTWWHIMFLIPWKISWLCIPLYLSCFSDQFHLTLKVQSSNVNVHTHSYSASATNCNVGRCFFNILHFFSWTQIFSIVTWLTWWQLLFSNWHLMLYLLISSILIFHPLTYDLWFIFL